MYLDHFRPLAGGFYAYSPILIGIAVLALALGIIQYLRARSSPVAERRFSRRTQLAISSGTAVVLVVLWLRFNLSPAILPALIVVQWLPLLSRRDLVAPKSKLTLIALAGLIVLLTRGTTVFWLGRN